MRVESFPATYNKPSKNEQVTSTNTKRFETKDGPVTLKWHICQPVIDEKIEPDRTEQAVLFLPGVAMEATDSSVVDSAQNFANASGHTTFAISARMDNSKSKYSQAAQSEAIRQLISSEVFREFTIVGHSQGANKAIELAALLENEESRSNNKINVRGLILTNPAGLYEQDSNELKKTFFKDAVINTPIEIIKQKLSKAYMSNLGQAVELGKSVASNIAKEVVAAPREFMDRVQREADEASVISSKASLITAPIVVIFGKDDEVFDSKKVIPDTAHDQSLKSQEERVAQMRKVFPKSAGIKTLEGSRLATHGLQYFRSEEVAKVGIGMLKRMERVIERNIDTKVA